MEQSDLEQISKAFVLAINAHEGQEREPGVPYVSHPIRVALHSMHLGFSPDAVIAAVLHDVVEDTDVPIETINEQFGEGVSEVVAALTKPPRGTPGRNRIYLDHLLEGPLIACQIKLLDIQDNLASIDKHFTSEKSVEYRESRTRLADALRKRIGV